MPVRAYLPGTHANRDDRLAERNDHDQAAAFGEVTRRDVPRSLPRSTMSRWSTPAPPPGTMRASAVQRPGDYQDVAGTIVDPR